MNQQTTAYPVQSILILLIACYAIFSLAKSAGKGRSSSSLWRALKKESVSAGANPKHASNQVNGKFAVIDMSP